MPAEEIFYLPLSELAKRIETKKLSPVELTQMYLDRSTKFGPRFNAYARLTPELALEQADTRHVHRHAFAFQVQKDCVTPGGAVACLRVLHYSFGLALSGHGGFNSPVKIAA